MVRLQSEARPGAPADTHGEISPWVRIGVFGHRHIPPHHPGLKRAIDDVLAALTHVRESIPVHSTRAGLAVVSSLAEGADRILARAVLALEGTRLEVILPLGQRDYRRDFHSAESRDEFDDLMDGVTVDVAGSAKSRPHAYESAARAVVDRSDVVVAVWDGKPARGRGGTADTYAYAVHRKKPVFWIRADGDSAELAEQPSSLSGSDVLLPPEALARLDRYNGERLPDPIFTDIPPPLTDLGTGGGEHDADTPTPLVQHVRRYFVRADALAKRFQRRWFWVTRLLYILAALAVAIVAAQILFAPRHEGYAWFEFGTLVGVTVLVILARFAHWHDRWISARYLAEQIRSLVFLGLVGVDTPDGGTPGGDGNADLLGAASWTDRAVAEIWWSRPRQDLTEDVHALLDMLNEKWIDEQLEYHLKTSKKYAERSRWFTIAAIVLFTVSAVAALLHSLGLGPEMVRPATAWDYLSIVIPAIGAAISGYAAQRDYTRHSERSSRLAAHLMDARAQLAGAENLGDIQKVVLNTRRLMRVEATDWYSVVRFHEIEPL